MNKGEFINSISDKTGVTKKDVNVVLSAIEEVIVETLNKGDKISLTGFGTFKVSHRAARTGHNPKTGESLTIAESNIPTFKAGSTFKGSIK